MHCEDPRSVIAVVAIALGALVMTLTAPAVHADANTGGQSASTTQNPPSTYSPSVRNDIKIGNRSQFVQSGH
jgi:hypothetical protein